MTLVELQKALRTADPGAVLVPARILEEIIHEACNLRGSVWNTPHRECFVVARQTLFRHIEQAYLDLEPDQLLPDTVILLARPPAEELSDLESKQVLLKYWRRLFHASVHLALDADHGTSEYTLTPQNVRERVDEIGRAEFEEIREVLIQDRYLLPEAGDRETYIEFAAVYLETRCFAASVLPALFPGIRDFGRVERMLARDVNAKSLLDGTRLKGAPDPVVAIDTGSEEPESHERYWTLVRSAERANLENDLVSAAILRMRASRIAPAALGKRTREEAEADMKRLATRIATSLRLSPAEEKEWDKDLPLLLDKADQGARPAEAKLLFELQKICSESERDLFGLDLLEWLLSAGKIPIKRSLPRLRQVRITRDLQSATRHLGLVRLHDVDRQHFTDLVQAVLAGAEQKIRDEFGKVLTTALEDVGLRPGNPPERVARAKMVAEWLDRIISHGFLTFSDLRDTISRNQLKMPDLDDPRDLIRGDPLLRLDRRLASLLDGVYRPSDMYMRWLEQLTAVNFGSKLGRLVTLWVTIPFGGAWLLLQLLGLPFHLFVDFNRHPRARWICDVLVGQSRDGDSSAYGPHLPWHFLLLSLIGAFLMALIHAARFRNRCRDAMRVARRGLRKAFVDWPRELFRLAAWQKLLRSWQFHLLRYVFKPLALVGIIWILLPRTDRMPGYALLLFLAATFAVNSRLGNAITEATWQILKSFVQLLRAGLLLGLYRFIMRVFKQVIDTIELILFTVDDWLRYRKGDSIPSLILRTMLGVLWFPISYLSRFFMLVMIEPGFNPAKAPISILAAKVIYPFALIPGQDPWGAELLRDNLHFPYWLAKGLAATLVWFSPDIFGFLFWETSENWSMYRSNRRRGLRAVPVGPHSETVKTLLLPGFHSGTVPRLFARLRVAEQHACWTRNWAAARACRAELEEVSRSLKRFVSRELLRVLEESPTWPNQRVSVGNVELTIKRILIELHHADFPTRPVRFEFELRHSALVAAVCDTGWLDRLTPIQLHSFTAALASLYKLAGVDLVCEQIQANLPDPSATWDVSRNGLVVSLGSQGPSITYCLRESDELAHPPDPASAARAIEASRLVFARRPLNWNQWVANWAITGHDEAIPGQGDWHSELVSLPQAPAPTDDDDARQPSQASPASLRWVEAEPSQSMSMTQHPVSDETIRTAEPA